MATAVNEVIDKSEKCRQLLRLSDSDLRPHFSLAGRTISPSWVGTQTPMSTRAHRLLIPKVVKSTALCCVSTLRPGEYRVRDSAGVHEGATSVERGKPLARVGMRGETRITGAAL